MRSTRFVLAALLASMPLLACSSHKVLMPPRIDLHVFGTIGLLDFSPARPDGLNAQATREFLASVQSAQPGVPLVELGDTARVLAQLGHRELDRDAIRAIGERHRVDTLVVGDLAAKELTPSFSLGTRFESASVGADIDGSLTVRMFDTHSGATLWTGTAHAREQIARIDVAHGGLFGVGGTDPGAAEARLARTLANHATYDFWPYWVEQ